MNIGMEITRILVFRDDKEKPTRLTPLDAEFIRILILTPLALNSPLIFMSIQGPAFISTLRLNHNNNSPSPVQYHRTSS